MDRKTAALERLKTVAGMDDAPALAAAGIRTVRDYAGANPKPVAKLTGQKVSEVTSRQRAARIHLRSGLDPRLCLDLVRAGARNSCEVLFTDPEGGAPADGPDAAALARGRVNVAWDNVRGFLASPDAAGRERVLAALARLKPAERRAALRSVEVIGALPALRWLAAEVERRAAAGLEPGRLEEVVAGMSEQEAAAILARLRTEVDGGRPQGPAASRGSLASMVGEGGGAGAGGGGGERRPPLLDIEGIGPAYAGRLAAAGVERPGELRSARLHELAGRTRIAPRRIWRWQAAATLLELPGVDPQIAEAWVAAGFHDLAAVVRADPMDLYHAIEAARSPREKRNLIPDTYDRVITPETIDQMRRTAYQMCFGRPGSPGAGTAPAARPTLSLPPFTEWIPARETNYGPGPSHRVVRYVVLHAMAGSMHGTIQTFQSDLPPDQKRSAHYLVGQDGRVVQMVHELDVAFHAANSGGGCQGERSGGCSGKRPSGETWSSSPCNCESLGIELEDRGGYTWDSRWATDQLYETTAQLVGYLCDVWGLSRRRGDRRIIGHQDVYNRTPGHDDPGPYWDWGRFYNLLDPAPPPEPEPHDDGKNIGGK